MIIGVDFDGTLCDHQFPKIGEPNMYLLNLLIESRRLKHQVILWTCRDGEYLRLAVSWCKEYGLEFDAVNKDVAEIADSSFGKTKSCKIYADAYIDDRNLAFDDLSQLLAIPQIMDKLGGQK